MNSNLPPSVDAGERTGQPWNPTSTAAARRDRRLRRPAWLLCPLMKNNIDEHQLNIEGRQHPTTTATTGMSRSGCTGGTHPQVRGSQRR